jgi:hypothetical protein
MDVHCPLTFVGMRLCQLEREARGTRLTAHSFFAFYSQSAGKSGAHASAWQPHSPSQQLGAV